MFGKTNGNKKDTKNRTACPKTGCTVYAFYKM